MPKPTDFKRGDKVLCLYLTEYRIYVSTAVVSSVVKGIVYTKHITEGSTWTTKYTVGGGFYQQPHPLWALRKQEPTDRLEALTDIAKAASARDQELRQQDERLEREAERAARDWKSAELERRRHDQPDRYQERLKAAALMGFSEDHSVGQQALVKEV